MKSSTKVGRDRPGGGPAAEAERHAPHRGEARFADGRASTVAQRALARGVDAGERGAPVRHGGPASAPGAVPVLQRLAVDPPTDWGSVRAMRGSGAGIGGVVFVSDGTRKGLVVKPNVDGQEEMAAAHAHQGIHGQGGLGRWKVKALSARLATEHDVAGIRVARDRVERRAEAPLDDRARDLINQVAAGTTLIQQAAAEGSGSLTEAMIDASAEGHLVPGEERRFSDRDRVKTESPLKALVNEDSGFARSLGRLAAADLLLGNYDRLAGFANLENFLVNADKKSIHPIDNVGGTDVNRLARGAGAGDQAWSAHPLVALFLGGQFQELASRILWGGAGQQGAPVVEDLVTGFIGPAGPGRRYTVQPNERQAVRDKLQRHRDAIIGEFARGLEEGRRQLRDRGGIPAGAGVNHALRAEYHRRVGLLV